MWLIPCAIDIFLAKVSTLYVVSARYPAKDKDLFSELRSSCNILQ